MVRKRIIRWGVGIVLIALVAFTLISNSVYQVSLPRVRTRQVEQETGELLDDCGMWEMFAWIPRECVFPGSSEETVCLYRIWQRPGLFTGTEDCVMEEEVRVLDEREDAVLVENLYLSVSETLVCETNLPLRDGETVKWLNGNEPDN